MANRIKLRMAALGLSQRALAREVGISHQAVSKIISGSTYQTPHILRIAKALQTTAEYLVGETDDASLLEAPVENENERTHETAGIVRKKDKDDLVEVREIDLTFGMGATYLDVPVTTQIREFNRDWLRQYTSADPDHLFFVQGIGDSMMPTLMNSDLLLIDTSQKDVRMADHIWAVSIHGAGMIKRLRPWNEGIKVMSDNSLVSDEVAYDGELHVIGRVVAIVRKI